MIFKEYVDKKNSHDWASDLKNAQKKYNVHFNNENDDEVDFRIIDGYKCSLREAGGDWEIPVFYFRCEKDNDYFCVIPGKKDGNFHLVNGNAPTVSEIKPNKNKCWHFLANELWNSKVKDLVKQKQQEIDKSSKEE